MSESKGALRQIAEKNIDKAHLVPDPANIVEPKYEDAAEAARPAGGARGTTAADPDPFRNVK